ncbi:MAG: hypothetical protein US51_C0037G0001, partial [Microgenomates group bacterium GW2011_GWA2_37_6]
NKSFLMLSTIIIGAFTWPTVTYAGIILYVFPRSKKPIENSPFRHSNTILSAICATVVILGIIFFHFIKKYNSAGGNLINEPFVLLSIVAVFLYVFFVTRPLFNFDYMGVLKDVIKLITPRRIIISVIMLVLFKFFRQTYSLPTAENPEVLRVYLLSSIQLPFIFLVSHVTYYGPIVLLIMLFWKKISKLIMGYGIGLVLLVLLSVIFAFESESRGLINLVPLIVVFTVKILDDIHFRPSFYWIFGIFSLFASKVWLPLNLDLGLYFMNFGPWMSDSGYIVQGVAALFGGIILYVILAENKAFLKRRTKLK